MSIALSSLKVQFMERWQDIQGSLLVLLMADMLTFLSMYVYLKNLVLFCNSIIIFIIFIIIIVYFLRKKKGIIEEMFKYNV